jgi:hypothetical protein
MASFIAESVITDVAARRSAGRGGECPARNHLVGRQPDAPPGDVRNRQFPFFPAKSPRLSLHVRNRRDPVLITSGMFAIDGTPLQRLIRDDSLLVNTIAVSRDK